MARGFAAKEPDRVDGLLLIVPARHSAADPLNLPPQVTLQRADELIPNLAESEIGRFQKLVVQSQVILEKIRRFKVPAVELADSSYQKRLNENYQFSFDLDDSKYVFSKPTLVLLGRYDTEVGYMDTIKAIENYPRATYAILDKAGHSLAWEQPELLRALVADWIARVEEYVE